MKGISISALLVSALLLAGSSQAAYIGITNASDFVQRSNGDIYVLMSTQFGQQLAWNAFPSMAKISNEGQFDKQFGKNGILSEAQTIEGGRDSAVQILLEKDRLHVFGRTQHEGGFLGTQWAYRFDGHKDTNFNGGEPKYSKFLDYVEQVLPWDSHSHFFLGGEPKDTTEPVYGFLKLGLDGEAITSFGKDGMVTLPRDAGSWRTCVGPVAGKMRCVCRIDDNSGVIAQFAEFDSQGLIKTREVDFSSSGAFRILVASSTLDEHGKIYLTGYAGMKQSDPYVQFPFIARLTSEGTLDRTFGKNGIVLLKKLQTAGRSVVARPGGGVYVSGFTAYPWSSGPWKIFVVALNQDGSLDVNFGEAGVSWPSLHDAEPFGAVIKMGSDGTLLMAGHSYYAEHESEAFIAKMDRKGKMVRSFGKDGFVTMRVSISR